MATREPAAHGLPDLAGAARVRRQPARPRSAWSPPPGRWRCCAAATTCCPADVVDVAVDVLPHRLVLTFDALADGVDPTAVVDRVARGRSPPPRVAAAPGRATGVGAWRGDGVDRDSARLAQLAPERRAPPARADGRAAGSTACCRATTSACCPARAASSAEAARLPARARTTSGGWTGRSPPAPPMPHVRDAVADRELETWAARRPHGQHGLRHRRAGEARPRRRRRRRASASSPTASGNRLGALRAAPATALHAGTRRAPAGRAARPAAAPARTPRAPAPRRRRRRRRRSPEALSSAAPPAPPPRPARRRLRLPRARADEPDWERPLRRLGRAPRGARRRGRRPARAGAARRRAARAGRPRDRPPPRGAAPPAGKLRERYADGGRRAARQVTAAAVRAAGAGHLVLRTDRDWVADLARFVARPAPRMPPAVRPAAREERPHDLPVARAGCWLLRSRVAALARRLRRCIAAPPQPLRRPVHQPAPCWTRSRPQRPGWRRHVPAALFLLMLSPAGASAFARPQPPTCGCRGSGPRSSSRSTCRCRCRPPTSTPTGSTAAKAGRRRRSSTDCPSEFNVGLVTFAGSAARRRPADHRPGAPSLNAIDDAEHLGPRTAIGEAIFTSLDAIAHVRRAGRRPTRRRPRIVLLSDGANTAGRRPRRPPQAAGRAEVPVSTIAYGTPEGSVRVQGQQVPVPVDGPTLQADRRDHRRRVLRGRHRRRAAGRLRRHRQLGRLYAPRRGGLGLVHRARPARAARRRGCVAAVVLAPAVSLVSRGSNARSPLTMAWSRRPRL